MTEKAVIWIGVLRDEGSVLYDPQRQDPKDLERAVLWLPGQKRFERYYKEMVRQYLEVEADTRVRDFVLTQYRDFQSRELEANHKNRLASLGVQYSGVSRSTKHNRLTNCYDCKQLLDGSIDVECNVCGWILCRCGACGCGYIR